MIESLCSVYDVLYNGGRFLSSAEQTKLELQLARRGYDYQFLAVICTRAGHMGWKQTVKLHYSIAHLAFQANS